MVYINKMWNGGRQLVDGWAKHPSPWTSKKKMAKRRGGGRGCRGGRGAEGGGGSRRVGGGVSYNEFGTDTQRVASSHILFPPIN